MEKLSKLMNGEIYLPSLEELDRTVLECKNENIEILAIAGGDGTIHQVLCALHRVYGDNPWPKLALLSSGTMNNIARNVGVRKKPLAQLKTILSSIQEGKALRTSTHHPLIFDESKAGFIFGQGGIARFLEAYYEGGNASQLKAAVLLVRAIISSLYNGSFVRKVFAPVKMNVVADGKKLNHESYTVSVLSSISDVGFGFRPCYAPRKNPAIAQFIGFTTHPVFTAFCLPKIWLAKAINHSSVQDSCAESFVLTPTDTMLYTIDGDLYECHDSLNIRIGPAVEFII